ncbi:MAG: hypothetical protein L6R42_007911, partial [Xanthoria sp. 1 TBL-2021]
VFERKDGRRPKLHTLTLHNIAIGTRDLVSIFSNGLPVLRTVALSMMLLFDGKWEWVIEFMHQVMILDEMDIKYGSTLLYPGVNFYEDRYRNEVYSDFMGSVCGYGARKHKFHPSIDFDDEDQEGDEVMLAQMNARIAPGFFKQLEDYLQLTQ